MELKWDLTKLFKNNEDLEEAILHLTKDIKTLKKYQENALNCQLLLEILNAISAIKEKINNLLIYGSLKYYQNVNDKKCIQMKEQVERLNNEVKSEIEVVNNKIIELGYDKVIWWISNDKKLLIYKMYIENIFRLKNHVQDEKTNNKIKELKNKIDEELKKYNILLRDIDYGIIIVEDKEIQLTASNYAKYLSQKDSKIRKDTYNTINQSLKKLELEFSKILNKIYEIRNSISQLEQYETVLEKVLYEENIDSSIIQTLVVGVHNNLKIIHKYLQLRSEFLEIEDVHIYDLNIPVNSNLDFKYTLDEAVEIIRKALKPLGEEYLEVVNFLLSNGYIDAELNENKHQSITFTWNVYSYTNFRGSYVDIKNLIHELGHAVNYYLSKQKQPFIYEDSTIFIGEIASIVNEMLLNKYLFEQAMTKEEQLFYLSKDIENYFTSIFKQTMYTEFEKQLYNIVSNKGILDTNNLNQIYLNMIKEYYGSSINYNDTSSIEWARLGHLYRWSYYPYKYATGMLMASIIVDMLNKESFENKQFIEFLSLGSSNYPTELLKVLNIDLTNLNTLDRGFKYLDDRVEKFEKTITLFK